MTFEAAGLLLSRHFVEWRASPDPEQIEALEEGTLNGVLSCEWVTLPVRRMEIFYWLGYCCPYC